MTHVDTDQLSELSEARAMLAHMQVALVSNRRIGIAIGILMTSHGLTDTAALRLLIDARQKTNRKVARSPRTSSTPGS